MDGMKTAWAQPTLPGYTITSMYKILDYKLPPVLKRIKYKQAPFWASFAAAYRASDKTMLLRLTPADIKGRISAITVGSRILHEGVHAYLDKHDLH